MNTNLDERNLNFDELLQELEQKPQQPQAEPAATLDPFDKEAYRERKQAERAEAFRLADVTAEKAAASGEVYADYLNVQASYNRYSVNNALLIAAQMPTATKLATFDEWRQNNVQIRGGAKAITLLSPAGSTSGRTEVSALPSTSRRSLTFPKPTPSSSPRRRSTGTSAL